VFLAGQRDSSVGRSKDWFVEAIVGIICKIVGLKSYAGRFGDYSGKVTPSRGLDGGYS
jgi:hypothetical protein